MLVNEDFFDDNTEIIDTNDFNDISNGEENQFDDNYDYSLIIRSLFNKEHNYFPAFSSRLKSFADCFKKFHIYKPTLEEQDKVIIVKYSLLDKPNLHLLNNFFLFLSLLVIDNSQFSIDIKKINGNSNEINLCRNTSDSNPYKIQPCVATLFTIHNLSKEYLKIITETKLKKMVNLKKWPNELINDYSSLFCYPKGDSDYGIFIPFSNISRAFGFGHSIINNCYISNSLIEYLSRGVYSFNRALRSKLRNKKPHYPELTTTIHNLGVDITCKVYLDILKDDNSDSLPVIGLVFRYLH